MAEANQNKNEAEFILSPKNLVSKVDEPSIPQQSKSRGYSKKYV